jgi:hypothetical protein
MVAYQVSVGVADESDMLTFLVITSPGAVFKRLDTPTPVVSIVATLPPNPETSKLLNEYVLFAANLIVWFDVTLLVKLFITQLPVKVVVIGESISKLFRVGQVTLVEFVLANISVDVLGVIVQFALPINQFVPVKVHVPEPIDKLRPEVTLEDIPPNLTLQLFTIKFPLK